MGVVIRNLRRDNEGVASTVGTIMALLVFLTFLSLLVNQYVPVFMKDSESAHMNTALGQFGTLKGAVDLQILAAQIAQDAGTYYIPATSSSPVTLGVDGVPIFSAPTPGEVAASPDASPWDVSFIYDIGGTATRVEEVSLGTITLTVANRYFVQQRLVYDSGAVIRWQADGQLIRATPLFDARRVNNTLDVSFQLVTLFGQASAAGTTTEIVNTKLFGLDRQEYRNIESSIWINHTTSYGLAWYQFFNNSLSRALGITAGTFTTSVSQGRILLLEFIGNVAGEDVYRARVAWDGIGNVYHMTLEILPSFVFPLGTFRLQHAYVQVGIGEGSEEL